jgi:hypothetical protein
MHGQRAPVDSRATRRADVDGLLFADEWGEAPIDPLEADLADDVDLGDAEEGRKAGGKSGLGDQAALGPGRLEDGRQRARPEPRISGDARSSRITDSRARKEADMEGLRFADESGEIDAPIDTLEADLADDGGLGDADDGRKCSKCWPS